MEVITHQKHKQQLQQRVSDETVERGHWLWSSHPKHYYHTLPIQYALLCRHTHSTPPTHHSPAPAAPQHCASSAR